MPRQAEATKSVTIVVAGSGGQKHDVEIQRGVTVRDLLERLNLTGHLSRLDDPAPLGENEEIYSRVQNGEKLILGPNTPVAAGRSK